MASHPPRGRSRAPHRFFIISTRIAGITGYQRFGRKTTGRVFRPHPSSRGEAVVAAPQCKYRFAVRTMR
ncbi:uncharacterized protein Dmul_03520 [Desulfococcus multivorans]|nr:uncharacterized protein Dmul_03520 [Desulfococcus multivorans]